MMFLEYAALGATAPILSLYLRQYLGFTGAQTGVVIAMSALATCASPLLTALAADRLLSAERLLAFCHLLAAGLVLLLWKQSGFGAVVLLYLLYTLALRPTIGLSNAVGFHHLGVHRGRFALVRVWGTVGWVVVSWVFSYAWLRTSHGNLSHALVLAAVLSLALFAYALLLPRPNVADRERPGLMPLEALRLFGSRDILVLALANSLVFIAYQCYYVGAAPFLRQAGLAERHIMPVMSLGQVSEVLTMWTLAMVMRRLGVRRTLALGIAFEIIRFTCFSAPPSTALMLIGTSCHGFSGALFMMASIVYLDSRCTAVSRSGAQLLFMMITFGSSSLIGSLLAGWAMDWLTGPDGMVNYRLFWVMPLAVSVAAMLTVPALKSSRHAGAGA